jgi:hypothetical protein
MEKATAAKPTARASTTLEQLVDWVWNDFLGLLLVLSLLRPCELHGLIVLLGLMKQDRVGLFLLKHCSRDFDLAIAKETPDKYRSLLALGPCGRHQREFPSFKRVVACRCDALFETLTRKQLWGTVTKRHRNGSASIYPHVNEFIWWGPAHGRSELVRLALQVERTNLTEIVEAEPDDVSPWRLEIAWSATCRAGDVAGIRLLLEQTSQSQVKVEWVEAAIRGGHLPVALELLKSGRCAKCPFAKPQWYYLGRLCTDGHIRELDWLKEFVFPQWPSSPRRLQVVKMFWEICERDNLDGAKWYANTFSITDQEAQLHHCHSLTSACDDGRVAMARWLVGRFHIERKKVAHWMAKAERRYRAEGPQESLAWLATEFV